MERMGEQQESQSEYEQSRGNHCQCRCCHAGDVAIESASASKYCASKFLIMSSSIPWMSLNVKPQGFSGPLNGRAPLGGNLVW